MGTHSKVVEMVQQLQSHGKAKRLNEIKGVTGKNEFLTAVQSLDTLEMVPIYYGIHHTTADKRAGLVNSRTGDLVGVASDKWQPINHAQAIESAINQISDTLGRDDFYGRVVNAGNRITVDILFGELSESADQLAYGLNISNSYRVGTALKIQSMFVRSACRNGMLWSEVSASVMMNHINTVWDMELKDGVYQVIDGLADAGPMIGTLIDSARSDIFNAQDHDVELFNLGHHYLGEKLFNRLQKSEYAMTPDGDMSRYDIYNMLTASATHLQRSPQVYDRIQNGAQYVLKTPSDILFDKFQRTEDGIGSV